MLKILFAGTPEVAVPALQALAADIGHFEVVAVLTRPDAPQGRGRKLTPSPVKKAALELDLPVLECDPKEPTFLTELRATGAEAGVVVAYGRILKEEVLKALPLGWYNLHFSLLPQWRGAAPVQRAIWRGDSITGVTVFQLTKGMDTGPILGQSTCRIGPHDTSGDMLTRLSRDGARLLPAVLTAVADDDARPQAQPQGAYEVAHKITHEDARVRFDVPAFAADRQIRACTPEPGAWCMLHPQTEVEADAADYAVPAGLADAAGAADGHGDRQTDQGRAADGVNGSDGRAAQAEPFHILQACPADARDERTPKGLKPGVLAMDKKHVWVGTTTAPLELQEVKAQGKKAMRAADWARGARLGAVVYLD